MSKIPPELESEMTPAVRTLVPSLLEQVDRLTEEVKSLTDPVEMLTDEVQKLTPRKSSVPPSTQHPHAEPKRKQLPVKSRERNENRVGRRATNDTRVTWFPVKTVPA